jgi:hypothetical protein
MAYPDEWNDVLKERDALRTENERLREALQYIVDRGYTGASYVAQQALNEVRFIAEQKKIFDNPELDISIWVAEACGNYYLALDEIERLQKRIAELEAERKLISVGERLPEEDDNYLILAFIDGIGEYYSVAQYIEGFFFDEYDNKTNDVDFWYPLPKPP